MLRKSPAVIVDDSIPKLQRRTSPEVDRKLRGETKCTVLPQKPHPLHEGNGIVLSSLSVYEAERQEESAVVGFLLVAVAIPEADDQPFLEESDIGVGCRIVTAD